MVPHRSVPFSPLFSLSPQLCPFLGGGGEGSDVLGTGLLLSELHCEDGGVQGVWRVCVAAERKRVCVCIRTGGRKGEVRYGSERRGMLLVEFRYDEGV